MRKTAAQIVAETLLRNFEERRQEEICKARLEFQMIVARWRGQHGFRSPQG